MSAGIEMASTEGGTPYIDFKNDPVDFDMRLILEGDNNLAVSSSTAAVARFGDSNNGVSGYGSFAGGYFECTGASAYGWVGRRNLGVYAAGNDAGGYFEDLDDGGYAHVGNLGHGIRAFGPSGGGYFESFATGNPAVEAIEPDSSGYLAYSGWGALGHGTYSGGTFTNIGDGVGVCEAHLGYLTIDDGCLGVYGRSDDVGGKFEARNRTGYSLVGIEDAGIRGYGDISGGEFWDTNASGWARVGAGNYKVYGSGTVSFVQNHPDDASRVVVYHAPEASEVAVYTRGTASTHDGIARIELDETFRWVTNPDLGLTAHVTPRAPDPDLHVVSVSPSELVVAGSADVEFDYMVWGLRIGFEESSPVQPKEREAYIPSMKDHRDMYVDDDSLRHFNALERFRKMEAERRGVDEASLDLSAAAELVARIEEYDPEVHGRTDPRSLQKSEAGPPSVPATSPDRTIESSAGIPARERESSIVTTGSVPNDPGTTEIDDPVLADATWLSVSEPVEAGDVLAIDPSRPSVLRRAASMADANVVGIAAGASRETADGGLEAPMIDALYGVVKVDAGYGAIRAGDLLVTSPTAGYAMRTLEAVPGTILGKALEPMETGTGTIRVLVTLR
jgi:hypothetical protein